MSAFRLPRPDSRAKVVNPDGTPTVLEQRWRQATIEKIEAQEAGQDAVLAQLQALTAQQAVNIENIEAALALAGIALSRANANMSDIPPVTIIADYAGAILTGQLPRNIQVQRFDADTDVTTESEWSAVTISGSATYTIGEDTGIINLTALASSSVIEVTSLYNGIARSRRVLLNKALQDPPASSGAGSESVYDSSITPTSITSYGSENAGPLTLTCGASGEIEFAAPLGFTTGSGIGRNAYGKWQISPAGAGTWTDVGTEIESVVAATSDGGAYQQGEIYVNMTATGLTPSADYDVRLLLRNASGAGELNYFGTATAATE